MNRQGRFFHHAAAPCCVLDHGALAGLRHRTVIDGEVGAAELALWQEEHAAGFHVPLHSHDCEEIITVLDGAIEGELEVDGILERIPVAAGESFHIPAGWLHGFQVTSEVPVRLLALFASSRPQIFKADGTPSTPPWEGGGSDHLATGRVEER